MHETYRAIGFVTPPWLLLAAIGPFAFSIVGFRRGKTQRSVLIAQASMIVLMACSIWANWPMLQVMALAALPLSLILLLNKARPTWKPRLLGAIVLLGCGLSAWPSFWMSDSLTLTDREATFTDKPGGGTTQSPPLDRSSLSLDTRASGFYQFEAKGVPGFNLLPVDDNVVYWGPHGFERGDQVASRIAQWAGLQLPDKTKWL